MSTALGIRTGFVDHNAPRHDLAFLQGGGEMAAQIRDHDWSRTPLGPIEAWPQSLRTVVGLMLNSRFPTYLVWGPELISLFNDAYRPILGAKPNALGRPFSELWQEAWSTVGPIAQRALAGEASYFENLPLTLERHGYPEATWWTFSYSPVRNESGEVGGVLCTVYETTAAVRAQAAVQEEKERLQTLFEQAPGLVAVLRVPGLVFEVVNATYRQFVGGRDLIGKSVREALPELAGQGYFELLDEIQRSGEPFVGRAMPVRLQRARGGPAEESFVDFVYQPIKQTDGQVVGIFVEGYDVTEQVRAETALRESEARFRNMADNAPVMMWVTDATGLCTYLNRSWYEFTGQVEEEALGFGWLDATHPDDRARAEKAFREAHAARTSFRIDYRLRRADGAYRWALDAASPRFDSDGTFLGYVGSVIDIDDRREAEERLRESEAKFQAIANSIDQMVWSTRPDGFHDFYNQRWYEYTGVPDGSTDGEGWNGVFHPEDQDRAWDVWRHSLETGEPYHIEYRLRHRSGHYRWVLGRAQPVRDQDGRITRWFGTCTDIQDIVEAREVLARSREVLEREIAERTAERDRIWQNSNELMGVFGFDGLRRAINPAWTQVLGYDEETLLSIPFSDVTHPEDRHRLRQAVEKMRSGERVVAFEDRLRHADGGYRTISWTGVPGDGVFYAIGRDVTDQRQAEEALRQAQKMEAVGQLTGGVAHDFNNLLTIIRSSTDLLRRPDLPEERRRRYVDAISDTVDRAAKLTGQLLAFARRQALKPEIFEVPERIRSVVDMLRTIVGSRIRIVADLACERCFVEADVAQFETALVNMAVNARDAMNGEGTLTVRVRSLPQMPPIRGHGGGRGSFVAISISDTGSGIPADRLAHIFEPFFTTKEVGKGTGLGLSQVYGFAKQSGGDVAVESLEGQGATFTLYLPRVEGEPHDAADLPGETLPEAGRGRRVLVVEDNVEVGTFSTQILQDLGYVTSWAANAADALRFLEEAEMPFDVVFSDVVMPGMSGVELGHEIRRRYPGLPVVLTSGYSHVLAEEGRHGFELLQKPYAAEELSRILRRVARERRRA